MAEILMDEQIKELRKKSKLIRDFSTQKKTPLVHQKIGEPIELFSEEYPNENPLISHWYFIALLDLTTCKDFRLDFHWIAKRLSISAYEAEFAWKFLISSKHLIQENGEWKKNELKLRLPTVKSERSVRKYHREMIQKGLHFISESNSNGTPFEMRSIGGLSFATNMEHLQKAKLYLQDMAYETAQLMSEGPCTEVYQLCYLLFPISKIK